MKISLQAYAVSFVVLFDCADNNEQYFILDTCAKFSKKEFISEIHVKELSDLCISVSGDLMNEKHIHFIEYLIQRINFRQESIVRLNRLIEQL